VSYIKERKMSNMIRTIISIPDDEKKWLDAYGRRHRISSAEVVRLAVREFRERKAGTSRAQVLRETAGPWRPHSEDSRVEVEALRAEWERHDITDMAELKRRAIAAAGQFASGVPDLSLGHDRYLTDEAAEDAADRGKRARAPSGPKRAGRKT
jgi:Arc/MetJ-type ribon-helix-helix transcriptional regulator